MKEWHVVLNGETQGPFTEDALREMAGKGTLTGDSFVWNGAPENVAKGWQKAADTEVAALLAQNAGVHSGTRNALQYQETAVKRDAYASRMKRLAAAMIDSALLSFPLVFLYQSFTSSIISSDSLSIIRLMVLLAGAIIIEFAVVGFNIYFLVKNGQTIGKKLLHIRIVNVEDGSKASFAALIFLRALLPGILGFVPFFPIADVCFIFRGDRRTLHDMIAGTIVVRE
jgi:uncharacterized RDD family membrane protein YckC